MTKPFFDSLVRCQGEPFLKRRFGLVWLSLLVVLVACFVYQLGDRRQLPDGFTAYGTAEGGELVVRDVIWHEVGGAFAKYRWISFVVLVENIGDVDLEVKSSSVIVKAGSVIRDQGAPFQYGFSHSNQVYVIIRPGEKRSIWAGGVSFPNESSGPIDWTEAEVVVQVTSPSDVAYCQMVRFDEYTVVNSSPIKGSISISGYVENVEDYPKVYIPTVFLSFFNDEGTLIGRGLLHLDQREHTFSGEFRPKQEPLLGATVHEYIQGFFVNAPIADFQVDAIQGDRLGGCK